MSSWRLRSLGSGVYQYFKEGRMVWPLTAAIVVGTTSGILLGAIIAPFLITVFDLPAYTIAGAALMGTFVSSIAGVASYSAMSLCGTPSSVVPDWKLGVLFGVGGAAGMYLGAGCQKYVAATRIQWGLAVVILLTAIRYVQQFLYP